MTSSDMSQVRAEGPHDVAVIEQEWLCPDSAHREKHKEIMLIFLHEDAAVRSHDFGFLQGFLEGEDCWVKGLHVSKSRDEVVSDFLEVAEQSGFDSRDEVSLFSSFEHYVSERVRCGEDGCDCSPVFPGRDELLARAELERG